MNNAIVLMTALLPTTGHADLVEFAAALPETRVWVLVNTRSFEPVTHDERLAALNSHFARLSNVEVVGSANDLAPQQPGDHPHFWQWWVDEINRNIPQAGGSWDFVVASEPYGVPLAEALGARFVSYDLERALNPVSGSAVRRDPWAYWPQVLPEFRRNRMTTLTLFGQESVGKTTLARMSAELLGVDWLPEWARLHLETVGPDLDESVMDTIFHGQTALQETARRKAHHPVLVQDTDLYSTQGYYQILGIDPPAVLSESARALGSDLYLVLPDDVPFVPDQLRYGLDVRESSLEFWTDLLTAAGQPWLLAPSGSVAAKAEWIAEQARSLFNRRWAPVRDFVREPAA